ncbi:hypothetical protein Poli38472_001420 [Pythium oligandrum]|uniref:SUI1 domain-containing protein n=1 Tax=Pythium oligandrum TaxID=41045 RepID=A0A8K1CTH4_PYTOL|nr:hypothetical protein Poli38472_001420 [Pythium oligandrum]|eukprot:TMW69264.1 hypothetical protein Poli38472_001420 [Pythium oligandrum]
MAHRERLVRFYMKYNADKIHEIDGVLERYKGKEAQLFNALVKKYGPEPSADEKLPSPKKAAPAPTKVVVNESKAVTDFNHARLTAFYQKYNPEKLGEVETVLAKYKGKEAQLFNALVKKYGPEPDDSDDEGDDDEHKAALPPTQEEEEEADDDDEDAEEDEEEDNGEPKFKTVVYCPIDTLPAEYCEYGPMFQESKVWLGEHYPNLFLQKYNRTVADFLDVERQIAEGVEGLSLEVGGKQVKKKKKKQDEGKKKEDVIIELSLSARKGKKRLTFITGLEDLEGVNMKDASKNLGKRFACSSSLSKLDSGKQQIQLQGDCLTELVDVIQEMFGISEDQIVVSEEVKKGGKKK